MDEELTKLNINPEEVKNIEKNRWLYAKGTSSLLLIVRQSTGIL